jgi:hypothetical protein
VGIKIRCRLCQKTTHNARRCPKNPEAGKKKNAYIKRDARKRNRNEESTFVEGTSNARVSLRCPHGMFFQTANCKMTAF